MRLMVASLLLLMSGWLILICLCDVDRVSGGGDTVVCDGEMSLSGGGDRC